MTSEDENNLRGYAESGNIEVVKQLIEKGVNINAADSEGYTALHRAMIWMPHLKNKKFLEMTKVLVENGADVNAVCSDGAAPLYLAAIEGFFDVVVYLHQKGAKITDLAIESGFNPIHTICKKIPGRPMNFTLIIKGKKITDPDEIRKIHGSHPDDEYFGYLNTAKYLIENGINVNQKTKKEKQTPLFHASDEGIQEIVEWLLKKGAEVKLQDIFGLTPLHFASRKGHLTVVKMLIKAGADVNAQENYGFTPLHEAAENDHVEVLKFLIKNGGDIKLGLVKDFNPYKLGDTPLEVAKKAKQMKIVNYLTELQ